MTADKIFRTEYAVLGGFLLLLLGLLFVPWSDFAAYHGATQNKKFGVLGMRSKAHTPKRIELWRAEMDYSAAGGVLAVDIANKYDEPLDEVFLRADFTSETGGFAGGAILRRAEDGQFRSDRLTLGRGNWLVGLSATRGPDFMFRLEQVLNVE